MSIMLSVTDAADLLRIHPMTVRRWATEGKIEARRVGGQWRIVRAAVERILGLPLEGAREVRSVLHAHDIQNDWIQQRKQFFQSFIRGHIDKFQPDYIILVDRKGRLFDSLSLIPSEFSQKVIYPSAIKWMSDVESLRGKRLLVLEESIQRGRNLRRIRQDLEDFGAKVLSLTLVRRRSLFESGEMVEPGAIACLDLSDGEFAHATAQISAVLQSDVICLDVDHFPTCRIRLKTHASYETVASALGALGRLFILPTPMAGTKVGCFTVDEPDFFDWEKLRLPTSFEPEGVAKLRVYYDCRAGELSLYIVPVVFPRAIFTADEISLIAQSGDEAWSRYVVIPDKWDGYDPAVKAELIYRCLVVFCSTQLVLQSLPYLRMLAEDLSLDLSAEGFSVADQGLNRTFGQIETSDLAERARLELVESWEKITQPSWHPVNLVKAGRLPAADAALDDSDDVDEVLRLLTSVPYASDTTGGLSKTELLDKLSWSAERLSRVFDFALDRGLLKPLVEVRAVDGRYCCLRTYRATEYGSWWGGRSEACTLDALAAKRISLVIPYVLDRLMSKGDSLAEGVPDMLRDKVFTNLQHDWDNEKFGRLYLGWAPHFFGPLPNVPALNRPTGGFQSIGQFALKRRVCELRKVNSKHSQKEILVPRNDVPWRDKLKSQITGIERDYLEGLVDIYYAIYHAFEQSADPLITLAACRNRFLTYVCAYQDLVLWRENMELALEHLDLNLTSTAPVSCQAILEMATAGRKQVEDKIRRYERLGEAKKVLSERLQGYPREALAQSILDSLEVPVIDDSEPYPLGRMKRLTPLLDHVTMLVHIAATKLGMASDKRPASKRDRNCSFYLNRLRDAYPELFSEDLESAVSALDAGTRDLEIVDLLSDLFVRVTRRLSRELKDPQDYSSNNNQGDRFLAGVIEASSIAPNGGETGILLLDILGFVNLSLLSAELGDVSPEVAATEFRAKVENALTEILNELRLEPTFMDPVGGDGWIIAHDDVEALLELSCRLNKARASTLRGTTFKTAITYGSPERVVHGAAVGRGFIKAYYVAEKTGMRGGMIRMTEEAASRVQSQSLRSILQKIDGEFELKTFGQCELYNVDWHHYGES